MRTAIAVAVALLGLSGCVGRASPASENPASGSTSRSPPVGGAVSDVSGCSTQHAPSREVSAPVLLKTLPGSWDEGWLSSPALVDLDGDKKLEIVAARHSVLQAWSADGASLWSTAFGHNAGSSPTHGDRRMYSSPAVGDFDGDGLAEIAVGSDDGANPAANVAVYDRHGKLRSGWPKMFGTSEVRSIAVEDVTGDGRMEVIVNKTSAGPSTAVYQLDGSMSSGWPQVTDACNPSAPSPPCFDYGGYNQNVGAADLNGDGVKDVVTTYDMMGFGIFEGNGRPFATAPEFRDRAVSGVEAYHDLALAKQGWGVGDRSEFTDSPPVMADVNGDGDLEVILAGNHEHSESTASQGFTLWVLNHDASRPAGWEWPKDTGAPIRTDDPGSNIVLTGPSVSVGDLDPSSGPEIVFPGFDGNLYAFRANGELLWTYAFGQAYPYVGATEAVIADLNKDGVPEVIFGTYVSGAPGEPEAQPHLVVLAADGVLLHKVPLSGRGAMAAPSVADLEGDGTLEIVLSLKDSVNGAGGVQIWQAPGSDASCVPWSTGRGNPLRTGVGVP